VQSANGKTCKEAVRVPNVKNEYDHHVSRGAAGQRCLEPVDPGSTGEGGGEHVRMKNMTNAAAPPKAGKGNKGDFPEPTTKNNASHPSYLPLIGEENLYDHQLPRGALVQSYLEPDEPGNYGEQGEPIKTTNTTAEPSGIKGDFSEHTTKNNASEPNYLPLFDAENLYDRQLPRGELVQSYLEPDEPGNYCEEGEPTTKKSITMEPNRDHQMPRRAVVQSYLEPAEPGNYGEEANYLPLIGEGDVSNRQVPHGPAVENYLVPVEFDNNADKNGSQVQSPSVTNNVSKPITSHPQCITLEQDPTYINNSVCFQNSSSSA
jgi:hypothetical protein